jgi:thiol-disulfide isomerase/thioredoxin
MPVIMHFVNHYSALIVLALLLTGGLSLVLGRGRKTRHWLMLGGVLLVFGTLWWAFRPVASPRKAPASGEALLLELQSPYCLGCVAMKPAVDRLERELRGRLVVRRVDIQSAEGSKLADQYGIEVTPSFIFFDKAGVEQWRSAGQLDALRVRTSLTETAR